MTEPTIDQHFEGRPPVVRDIYDKVVRVSRSFGPFDQQPKKTSIHLARKSAFAGVATRKDALVLTIKAAADINDKRVFKREKVSANRWHLEVRLEHPEEIDSDVSDWLRSAYEISG